jgi:hypothetical protein
MAADDLYGLPLERFVSERDALVRALRADGRREQAAEVARLRKPSVAAWAVNQLVRTQGSALADLFDAGDALHAAQTEVLAGRGDGRGFRATGDRERAAVAALVVAARGLLTSDGHELSEAVIDRVADTIHAAALDDDARASVRAGRLERELRHVGFGVGAGPGGAPSAHAPDDNASATGQAPLKDEAVNKRKAGIKDEVAAKRAAARRHERERAKARKAARATESEAGRRAARAARALQVAQERRARAAATLRLAEEGLATAHAEAETTTDLHRRAQRDLKGLEHSAFATE